MVFSNNNNKKKIGNDYLAFNRHSSSYDSQERALAILKVSSFDSNVLNCLTSVNSNLNSFPDIHMLGENHFLPMMFT